MDAEELDLTIVEATDEYRPGHENGNGGGSVDAHAAETRPGDGILAPPASAQRSSLDSRIEQLEADVASWQRRTTMWRERALSTQALNEALNRNLDDLRVTVRSMVAGATRTPEVEVRAVPARQHSERPLPTATVVEWCNRVFRRDFWTGPR
jgi:hypothetical protein